jgi:hypothetical protein
MGYEENKHKEEEQTRCVCNESDISVRIIVRTSELLRSALQTIGYVGRIEVPIWA